jgi:hypothetical protein
VAEDGDDDQREQDARERHHHVDDAHDQQVRPAPGGAAHQAEAEPAREGDHDRAQAGDQREARAGDHAGEDVAAVLVGAEGMGGARRRERVEQVHLDRVGAGHRGAGHGEPDDEREDGAADHGRLAPREQANGGGHATPPRWRMRGSITEYETSTSRLTRT